MATYTVHFHDKDLYARPTRFDTSSYTEFIIDPIVYYDYQKGQEVTLTVSEMAACCNIAGMMPEMFTIQPQRKMDNTGVGYLTRKFSLFIPNGFTESYGSQNQSGEYYIIQKGPNAGTEICKPCDTIAFPPRAIAYIDPNGDIHHRKPFLRGTCADCRSYNHKKGSKDCVYTGFCMTCLDYLPDYPDGKGFKHACTAGIPHAGSFSDSKVGGKAKGNVKLREAMAVPVMPMNNRNS